MATLNECKNELRSIITELYSIESGLRSDFDNIGEDLCANCIKKLAIKYEVVSFQLNAASENIFVGIKNLFNL